MLAFDVSFSDVAFELIAQSVLREDEGPLSPQRELRYDFFAMHVSPEHERGPAGETSPSAHLFDLLADMADMTPHGGLLGRPVSAVPDYSVLLKPQASNRRLAPCADTLKVGMEELEPRPRSRRD